MNYPDKPLFSFGTLMDCDVLSCVTNLDKEKLVVTSATLNGYYQRNVVGENFPVILADENSTTEGIVIHGLNADAIERVLFYEGDEYYLAPVTITGEQNAVCGASVFLSNGIYRTENEAWNFDRWQRFEKTEFLSRVRNYMQYFGQLSATDADKYW